MAIEFSCSQCGRQLRAPENAAGRKCRCPDCGDVATVPGAEPPPLPSASQEKHGVTGGKADADSAAVVREPNWPLRIVGAIIGVGVVAIAGIGYYGYSSSQKKMEERDRLTRVVDDHIQSATNRAGEYDFDGAKNVLLSAATEVEESPYADVYLYDELTGKINSTRNEVQRCERDYHDKVRSGWVMFEGKFISGAEQRRILAERRRKEQEEERRLQEEERRRQEQERLRQERLRRQQEEEAQRQALAEADERAWALAWQAWGERPVVEGVGGMIRYLHFFPEGAHVEQAQANLAAGLEQVWSARVVELMGLMRQYDDLAAQADALAQQYRRMGFGYERQAIAAWEESKQYLYKSLECLNELTEMGFAGDTDMYFPDQSPAGVIRALRPYRANSSFEQWKAALVRGTIAAFEKSQGEDQP